MGHAGNSAVGTVLYTCPEIVQGRNWSDKADIWSLGCILYQMATLRPPFAGSNPLSVARAIVERGYDPIDDVLDNDDPAGDLPRYSADVSRAVAEMLLARRSGPSVPSC